MSYVANFAGVAIAFQGFVWGVAVHLRDARTRKYADQAERAGQLLELLQRIDLGGADRGLDPGGVRIRHDKQIRDLQRVVRVSAAEFSARALRPAASRFLIGAFAGYGLFFLLDGISLCISGAARSGQAEAASLLIGGAIGALGVAGLATSLTLGHRRSQSRDRACEAGVTLTTSMEEVRRDVTALRTWFTIRKLNRDRLHAVRPSSSDDPAT